MKPLKNVSNKVLEANSRGFAALKIASPWKRLTAQIIDQGLVWLPSAIFMATVFNDRVVTKHWWIGWVLLSVYVSLITQILFLKIYGTSPGKRLLGIRIQSSRPNQGVAFTQIVLRTFGWWLGIFSLGATWVTILGLSDRRAWHDMVAETVVVHDEDKPNFTTEFQKSLSIVWIGTIIAFFLVVLMAGILYEFKALKSGSLTIADEPLNLPSNTTWRSWFLAGNIPLPRASNSNLDPDEKKLVLLMESFEKARDLSPGKRFEFYRAHMEPIEDFFCRSGRTRSVNCQTAQALAGLLVDNHSKTLHDDAVLGIKFLEKVESLAKVDDQILYIENELKNKRKGTLEYQSLRSAEAKFFMKAGDIKSAKEIYRSLLEDLRAQKVVTGTPTSLMVAPIAEATCQTEALTDCEFRELKGCLENPYWQAWSKGCRSENVPEQYEMSAEALGFWWKIANVQGAKFESLKPWDDVKTKYAEAKIAGSVSPTANGLAGASAGGLAGGFAGGFERYVISAVDFALNLKTQSPGDLVEKSKNLSFENPLWGWAQTQALYEFGSQWPYLVNPAEQKQIAKYRLEEHQKQGELFRLSRNPIKGSTTEASTSATSVGGGHLSRQPPVSRE